MLGENNTLEKSVEEILVDLMNERVMSVGILASLTRRLQASPLNGRRSGRTAEKRRRHRDDLANGKKISLVFLEYIPPLAGLVNHDSILCDFEYTLMTMYIPKGIHVVGPQLGHILSLKNNEFNLGDRKKYAMLALHQYLMRMNGKKLRIVS
jgi:hypothetical protein